MRRTVVNAASGPARRGAVTASCVAGALFMMSTPVVGQLPRPKRADKPAPETAAPVPATPPATARLTAEDLTAFVDGIMPLQLRQGDIAGAVVTVVKDGKVIFGKGYGYSDARRRTPVTVDSTLFRIGSVSKTFGWTAVMQLVEQGKIDLDRDVNAYLDFKVPATFGKPLTMRHLMTHTPGFEEVVKDLFINDAARLRPLSEWLTTHLPRQIYPPGTTPAYSNYGSALAGYIVQRVSGIPFDEYVKRNVLEPLGSPRITYAQPLPPDLAPMMSQGYAKASDDSAKAFEIVQAWPAGSIAATAEGMSRYMIAYLEDDGYNGATLMKPETRKQMLSRAYGAMPALNGMAYGFYEETRNGHRVLGHGGDTQWFHSDMHLMPEDHVGFFMSYNSTGNGKTDPRGALWRQFLERYFPYTPPASTVASPLRDAQAVAGTYVSSRRSKTTLMAPLSLLGQLHVTVNSDSTISNGDVDLAGNPKRYREIAPNVFREVNGQDLVGFARNYAGQMVMGIDLPFLVGTPASLRENGKINFTLLGFAVAVFALSLIFWPVNAMLRRHYAHRPELTPAYRRLRLMVRIAGLLAIVFLALWVQFFAGVEDDIGRLSSGAEGRIRVLQLLGFLGVLGTLAAVYLVVRSWSDRTLWVWTKVWNTMLAVAFLAYSGFLLNWHLLTLSLRY